jgi:glycosyltransferase involved in cell wall biosynthesis
MRIISINSHYQDKLGYQDYFFGLEFKKMGHEVHFISSDVHFNFPDYDNTVKHIIGDKYVGVGTFINDYNVPVHRLKSISRIFTGNIWLKGFEKKIIELDPDFIISHGLFSWQSIRLLFLNKKIRCPIVFDDHTTSYLVRKDMVSGFVFWLFRILFAKKFMKTAHAIVGISETCPEVIRNYYGISGKKVKMIPLGTDTDLFNRNDRLRNEYRRDLEVKDDEIIVLYTGKMYESKKVHLIIEALNDEKVCNDKKIVIHLVGDIAESYRMKLDQSIKGSKNRVIIRKAVSMDRLPAVYNAADIAVWPDSLTTSTIDASACGCPIICSHHMPERVKYNNGILVKGGDLEDLKMALAKLISDKQLRQMMGEKGIEYVSKELSWNIIAKMFLN